MEAGVWIRGTAVADTEACELARRLRLYGGPIGVAVAERLERGVLVGTAIIGTSSPEARVVLTVIEHWAPERLQEVATSLREFIGDTPAARLATRL